ncbi:MAG: DUF5996 family protein [Gemmatimonadota bacterium]|nr:DUF5996 family protein [Gemmatimonadota bacterium]
MTESVIHPTPGPGDWPSLPLNEWKGTCATLHMWTQIVGKTRLALAPMENHWWNVPLYVTPRGLTTSAVPCRTRTFEATFDFLDHELTVRVSDGGTRAMPLAARSVADFYAEYTAALRALGIDAAIWPVPVEVEDPVPFAADTVHASYDAAYAERFWRALLQADRVLKRFRGRFLGKASPVHFFWGSFDLAATRFSGRRAPVHPGGIPHLADWVTREAYSHECSSAGWWPGGRGVDAAFYAYAYPEPDGYPDAPVRPREAFYSPETRGFILPYDTVRTASDRDGMLLDFFQSTYEAEAKLAGWDRAALERPALGP